MPEQQSAKAISGYRGLRVNPQMLRDRTLEEYLLDLVVENNPIPVPAEQVQAAQEALDTTRRHQRQYSMLTGGAWQAPPSAEKLEAEALRQVRLEHILRRIAAQEGLTVHREALETEAAAIAKRQKITLDTVYSCLGTGLAALEEELLARQAIDLILNSAVVLNESQTR